MVRMSKTSQVLTVPLHYFSVEVVVVRYVRFAIYQCKSISSFFLCVLGYQLPNEEGWYLHKLEFTSIPTWHCKTEEREKPLRDSHD